MAELILLPSPSIDRGAGPSKHSSNQLHWFMYCSNS